MKKISFTLAFFFFCLNLFSQTQKDSIHTENHKKKYLWSIEYFAFNAKTDEETSKNKLLSTGFRTTARLNNEYMEDFFLFSDIFYEKIETEEFGHYGKSIFFKEEQIRLEAGPGFSKHVGIGKKKSFGLGFEITLNLIPFFLEDYSLPKIKPYIFFKLTKRMKLEFGDEINMESPTIRNFGGSFIYCLN